MPTGFISGYCGARSCDAALSLDDAIHPRESQPSWSSRQRGKGCCICCSGAKAPFSSQESRSNHGDSHLRPYWKPVNRECESYIEEPGKTAAHADPHSVIANTHQPSARLPAGHCQHVYTLTSFYPLFPSSSVLTISSFSHLFQKNNPFPVRPCLMSVSVVCHTKTWRLEQKILNLDSSDQLTVFHWSNNVFWPKEVFCTCSSSIEMVSLTQVLHSPEQCWNVFEQMLKYVCWLNSEKHLCEFKSKAL